MTATERGERAIRDPSVTDAVIPLVALAALLALGRAGFTTRRQQEPACPP
jgi:hypothetical protein